MEHYLYKTALVLTVTLIISVVGRSALAKDVCDAQSTKGDTCLCKLSDLHPTQVSVGMAEVRIKAEKLNDKMQGRSEKDFLKYLLRHDKAEPVIIGPGANNQVYLEDENGNPLTPNDLPSSVKDLTDDPFCKGTQRVKFRSNPHTPPMRTKR